MTKESQCKGDYVMTVIKNNNPPDNPITTYKEIKIGTTIYCLTSKFEGKKQLNETLKRLAVKQATELLKGA